MTMTHLDRLESQSIYIFREAFARIDKLGMLWSLGKDSNTMVWLARKAFFGRVPFPVVHLDTGAEFPEVYAFRERYVPEWGLNLIADICPPIEEVDPSLPPASRFAARKTEGLKVALAKYGFTGIIAGIRRDEQATRAKERVFSPRLPSGEWNFRDQPPEFWDQFNTDCPPGAHVRIHPLLHWTELDVWRYVRRERIPVVPLYFARDGMRYRSLGEVGITFPIPSTASTIDEIIDELSRIRTEERAGRAMDHESEDAFERLRVDGYM
jgi:sulfate adenylyltransferase subunit 2